jgi:hypothetical protein
MSKFMSRADEKEARKKRAAAEEQRIEDKIKELQKGESSNNILAAPDKLVPVKPFRVHG